MPKQAESTINRLVRHLAAASGTGILGEVSRRLGLCGALARALKTDPALAQFVTLETVRNKASHRLQTRLSLTPIGTAYAQTLKPGWKPARLSLVDWQSQLSEMTAERVPAALQIARDAADGLAWRNHEAQRKAADRVAEAKRAKRDKPEPKYPSAGRSRSDEENAARAEWFRDKTGKNPSYADDAGPDTENLNQPKYSPIPSSKPAPQTPQEEYLAMLAQQNRIVAEAASFRRQSYVPKDCLPVTPTTTATGESRSDIIRRANIAGYPTRGGNQVMLNSEWVSCEKWAAANPK